MRTVGRAVDSQLAQGVQHVARVVGLEHVVDARLAGGQCGEQQYPVGYAFRTRQLDGAADPRDGCKVEIVHDFPVSPV